MEGVMSLPDFLLPQVKSPSAQSSQRPADDQVSFGNLFERWLESDSQIVNGTSLADDEKILLKTLEQLINFRLLLAKNLAESPELELAALLEKMTGDSDFLASLPFNLQALLQKLIGKDTAQIAELLSQVDSQVKDELVERWYKFQEEKEIALLLEVNDLIFAIQGLLQSDEAKIGRFYQIAEEESLLEGQLVDDLQSKIDRYIAQKGSQDSLNQLTVEQRLLSAQTANLPDKSSQSLLSQVTQFLSKAETTAEKLGFQESLVDLKSELQNYLAKKNQNRFYLSGNNHYLALRVQAETAGNVGDLAEKVFQDPLSETGMSDGKQAPATYDFLANNLAETDLRTTENFGEKRVESFPRQAEQVFQQIVEGFKLDIKQGVSQMEMRLYPEELGRLLLKLTLEEGLVTAKFVTETFHVKEMIELNLPHLRESMLAEGIYWDKISVDVGHDGLAENPFLYQGHEQPKEKGNLFNQQNSFTEELIEEDLLREESIAKESSRLVDYLV